MADTHLKDDTARCPVCFYQSPFELVRCPRYESTFDAGELNELGHLTCIREWLIERRNQELLPEALWAELLETVHQREVIVRMALSVRAPATAAPSDPVPVDADRILNASRGPVAEPT